MSDYIKPNANGTSNEGIQREKVRVVPLKYVDDFPNHPYKVVDDASMDALVDSIRNEGVLNPIIVIKTPDERYQVISGHRRKHACEKLGIELIQVIVRDISRDEAIIAMVDSNLQRENILPSEKAAAYKMKMDAMRRKAGRPGKDNSTPVAGNYKGIVLTENEMKFLRLFKQGIYQPELVFDDTETLDRIVNHPMALWKTAKNRDIDAR